MNGRELDAAIEQANRIFRRQYQPSDRPQRNAEPPTSEPKEIDWPSESLDAERCFGQSHARLFVYLGRKVRTPGGPGTLLQVFTDRVTVLLDAELCKCAVFTPQEVAPCDWSV